MMTYIISTTVQCHYDVLTKSTFSQIIKGGCDMKIYNYLHFISLFDDCENAINELSVIILYQNIKSIDHVHVYSFMFVHLFIYSAFRQRQGSEMISTSTSHYPCLSGNTKSSSSSSSSSSCSSLVSSYST